MKALGGSRRIVSLVIGVLAVNGILALGSMVIKGSTASASCEYSGSSGESGASGSAGSAESGSGGSGSAVSGSGVSGSAASGEGGCPPIRPIRPRGEDEKFYLFHAWSKTTLMINNQWPAADTTVAEVRTQGHWRTGGFGSDKYQTGLFKDAVSDNIDYSYCYHSGPLGGLNVATDGCWSDPAVRVYWYWDNVRNRYLSVYQQGHGDFSWYEVDSSGDWRLVAGYKIRYDGDLTFACFPKYGLPPDTYVRCHSGSGPGVN